MSHCARCGSRTCLASPVSSEKGSGESRARTSPASSEISTEKQPEPRARQSVLDRTARPLPSRCPSLRPRYAYVHPPFGGVVVGLPHLGGGGGCPRSPWWLPFLSSGADCPCLLCLVWWFRFCPEERAMQAATHWNGEDLLLPIVFSFSVKERWKKTPPTATPRDEIEDPTTQKRSDSGKPATHEERGQTTMRMPASMSTCAHQCITV